MIAHFGVVKNAFVRLDPVVFFDLLGKARVVVLLLEHGDGLLDRIDVIFGQGFGISTRIGQYFVFFVQRLRQTEGVFRGEAKARVRLALQAGEVKQRRCHLRGWFGLFGHAAVVSFAGHDHGVGGGFAPQTVVFALRIVEIVFGVFIEFRVEPAAVVHALRANEFGVHFPVVARDKATNRLFALDHDGQCRRLHTAYGSQEKATVTRVKRGHGSCAVDPDQPISLGARARRIGQIEHLRVRAQICQTIANRLRGHALQPQALRWLLGLGVLYDVAENQFALAPRVACVNHVIHVLATQELCQRFEFRLRFRNRLEVKMRWNVRQVREAPFAAFDLVFLGNRQFEQMTDRRGDHILIVLMMVVFFHTAADRAGDVVSD